MPQTTCINVNGSYGWQANDYAFPGGTPGSKPFPTGAWTVICFYRPAASCYSSAQDYQTLQIVNCNASYGPAALEWIIAGDAHPNAATFDGMLYLGGYDSINGGAGEEKVTGLVGTTEWVALVTSWDGVGGTSGNPIKGRYRRHSDAAWTTVSFDGPAGGSYPYYAHGDVYRLFLCSTPAEQPGDVKAACYMMFQGELTEEQLNLILAAGGDVPSSLVSAAVRHFPLSSAATANQEMIVGAHAVYGGTATDAADSPFPWPGAATGKGDFPFRSTWFTKRRWRSAYGCRLPAPCLSQSPGAQKDVWSDWFFGASGITADASVSIGDITLSSTGSVDISGDLSASIGEVTLVSTSGLEIVGECSVSIGSIVCSAYGNLGALVRVGSGTASIRALPSGVVSIRRNSAEAYPRAIRVRVSR